MSSTSAGTIVIGTRTISLPVEGVLRTGGADRRHSHFAGRRRGHDGRLAQVRPLLVPAAAGRRRD